VPRKAREKSPHAIYHIMCRSISECLLFVHNEDKTHYLLLLKRFIDKYQCSLLAFCLMGNHVHLHLDPRGFDISTFMRSLNTAYVRYYNKKHNRHGHLFQDRFESRILSTDEYNLAVSAYIHNNPRDIPSYFGHEETYEYSSYGIYLGKVQDHLGLIDTSFIKGLFGLSSDEDFAKRYYEFVRSRHYNTETKNNDQALVRTKVEYEYLSGRNVVIREKPVTEIIQYISGKFKHLHHTSLKTKARHHLIEYRAFTAYVLRVLCNLSYKQICEYMYNITATSCSRLCNKGYELINDSKTHLQLFNELIAQAV